MVYSMKYKESIVCQVFQRNECNIPWWLLFPSWSNDLIFCNEIQYTIVQVQFRSINVREMPCVFNMWKGCVKEIVTEDNSRTEYYMERETKLINEKYGVWEQAYTEFWLVFNIRVLHLQQLRPLRTKNLWSSWRV